MSVRIIERLNKGLTYAEYLAAWRDKLKTSTTGLDKDARKRIHYVRYNIERHDRVAGAYRPSDALVQSAAAIDRPQLWMVLAEEWCGDAAFAMPIIAAAAGNSDHVELRILRRDDNLDLMDRYLTNGSRSIPKLVAFDMNGEELFQWGPRPATLQALREDLVAKGMEPGAIVQALVAWYEAGNWSEIDAELAALIEETQATVA